MLASIILVTVILSFVTKSVTNDVLITVFYETVTIYIFFVTFGHDID